MDVPVNYLQDPSIIANEALDRLGCSDKITGALTDGTNIAEAARRNYGQALRQLLRTAWWGFARKRAQLQLLGDSSGQAVAPISPIVEHPWRYAYSWPTDAVQGRWLPWKPANAQPVNSSGVPLTTAPNAYGWHGQQPGRFLVSSSDQYPIVVGSVGWDQLPDLQRTEGLGPTSRKIILTDCCDAWFVYTRLVPVIEEWDSLFREAMVMMIAMALAPVAIEDPKLRIAEVDRLKPALKNAIDNARLASANEAGFPQTVDFEASFIRARNFGTWGDGFGFGMGGGGGVGYMGMGFDSCSWAGSVF
jgi:hypothetical protein